MTSTAGHWPSLNSTIWSHPYQLSSHDPNQVAVPSEDVPINVFLSLPLPRFTNHETNRRNQTTNPAESRKHSWKRERQNGWLPVELCWAMRVGSKMKQICSNFWSNIHSLTPWTTSHSIAHAKNPDASSLCACLTSKWNRIRKISFTNLCHYPTPWHSNWWNRTRCLCWIMVPPTVSMTLYEIKINVSPLGAS